MLPRMLLPALVCCVAAASPALDEATWKRAVDGDDDALFALTHQMTVDELSQKFRALPSSVKTLCGQGEPVAEGASGADVAVASDGTVHVVYRDQFGAWATRRAATGTWSLPRLLTPGGPEGDGWVRLQVSGADTYALMAFSDGPSSSGAVLSVFVVHDAGPWTLVSTLKPGAESAKELHAVLGSDGMVHAVWSVGVDGKSPMRHATYFRGAWSGALELPVHGSLPWVGVTSNGDAVVARLGDAWMTLQDADAPPQPMASDLWPISWRQGLMLRVAFPAPSSPPDTTLLQLSRQGLTTLGPITLPPSGRDADVDVTGLLHGGRLWVVDRVGSNSVLLTHVNGTTLGIPLAASWHQGDVVAPTREGGLAVLWTLRRTGTPETLRYCMLPGLPTPVETLPQLLARGRAGSGLTPADRDRLARRIFDESRQLTGQAALMRMLDAWDAASDTTFSQGDPAHPGPSDVWNAVTEDAKVEALSAFNALHPSQLAGTTRLAQWLAEYAFEPGERTLPPRHDEDVAIETAVFSWMLSGADRGATAFRNSGSPGVEMDCLSALGADAPDKVVRGVQRKGHLIKPRSACPAPVSGLRPPSPDGAPPPLFHSVTWMRWVAPDRVKVGAGSFRNGLDGAGYLLVLEKNGGRWKVVSFKTRWVS